jgi:hypothetical protein
MVGAATRKEVPMAVKCVTCGLLFRTENELEWHIRQEHLRRRRPRPAAPVPDQPAARDTPAEDEG